MIAFLFIIVVVWYLDSYFLILLKKVLHPCSFILKSLNQRYRAKTNYFFGSQYCLRYQGSG